MSQITAQTPENNQRRRKVQAVLAGGLVLGVGAVITLAAWNDSEFAQGIFSSGSFNLEGSTSSTGADASFEDHGEDNAALLSFATAGLIPGETTYAPFWVRLDEDTTVGGAIEQEDGIAVVSSSGGNVEHLSYTVYADPESCDSGAAATGDAVASGDDLEEGIGTDARIPLTAGSGDAAGAAVLLCFAVTADTDDLAQNEGAEAVWEVVATSDEG